MSDDLTVIQEMLELSEDDASFVLELCDMLEREDQVAVHGYPKDSPRGRDLAARLRDEEFCRRLGALARAEGAGDALLKAFS